jgi:predicted secreted hydrolase
MMRITAVALTLLGAAVALALAQTSPMLPWRGAGAGFEPALTPRPFEFPQDHGPHPAFAHEWWYVTGHLATPRGERFGFELTFFRVGLAAPGAGPSAGASRWHARQMFMAHFAVTDIARQRFESAERDAREALGLAGAQSEPVRIWLDDWSLELAGTIWRLKAAEADYALELTMQPVLAPVPNGQAGLSEKSDNPADASYYYSIPRLTVQGQLTRGSNVLAVHGDGWLDREWGSGALAPGEAGWDWFALQLEDGSELMFYALRRRDGTRESHSAGTWVSSDGRVRALSSADVRIAVLGGWESPRGGRYPARWSLEVPALGLKADIRPVLADQELNGRPRYWEGAVVVHGTRGAQRLSGNGYVELVGYAASPQP